MDRLQVCYQCGREMPYKKRAFGSNRFCSRKCSAVCNARNGKIKLGWFQKIEKIKRMMADGANLARKDIRETKRVLKRHIRKILTYQLLKQHLTQKLALLFIKRRRGHKWI